MNYTNNDLYDTGIFLCKYIMTILTALTNLFSHNNSQESNPAPHSTSQLTSRLQLTFLL